LKEPQMRFRNRGDSTTVYRVRKLNDSCHRGSTVELNSHQHAA
jgi:hypothetical protein